MTGASPSSLRDARAVERRGHHQELQIVAQALLHIECQRQSKIGVERALVEFVEQQRSDAVERRVVQHHAGEHALGHHLDAGRPRHLRAEAHAVADGLTDLLPQGRRHARRGGAGRQPARLQHDDLLILGPGLLVRGRAARASSCRRRAARPAPPQLPSRNAAVSAGSASSIGSAGVKAAVVNAGLIKPLAPFLIG